MLLYFRQATQLSKTSTEFIMLRRILAVLVGLVVAFGTVALVEWFGHQVYPPPPDLDFTNAVMIKAYISTLPLGAFLFVLLAWFSGTLAGGMVACRIAQSNPVIFASIIGAMMLVATIANLMMIPHPTWFSITAIVLIAAGTLLAIRWSSISGVRTRAL
jgi:hypothetical protein